MISRNDIHGWNKLLLSLLLLFLFLATATAQESRSELESRRKQLQEDIEATARELSDTRKTRQATLNRFLILRRSIQQRQALIQTLEKEVSYTNQSIERTQIVLEALEGDLDRLKQEYSQLLRIALRHKLSQSYLQFLFSARSLNDAFQRWQYIRQYERYRKRQANLIQETQMTLQQKADELTVERAEKDSLLLEVKAQQSSMETELQDKNRLLVSLQSDEKRLADELAEQERAVAELNQLIENVIRKEMLAKRKRARTPDALENTPETPSTDAALSAGFADYRGRLPWPVSSGTIIKPFGVHPHPRLKSVKITNNGIDIRTEQQAPVRAVFEGTVAGTQFIPGYQNTVIIQHGQYYTVYSNLAEVFVKRGDIVQKAQQIGRLNSTKPEVHFEVWREKNRLNPEQWVQRD